MNAIPDGCFAVRPTVPADLVHLKAVIDATGLFPPDLLDEMTAPFLAGARHDFWLTLDRDGPCGMAYCAPERMTEGSWNLLLIAVHPAQQGRGGGAELLRVVEREVAERSGRILLVETSHLAQFDQSRRFYAGQGFVQEARIRDYYQAGEDKIVFWKSLSKAQ